MGRLSIVVVMSYPCVGRLPSYHCVAMVMVSMRAYIATVHLCMCGKIVHHYNDVLSMHTRYHCVAMVMASMMVYCTSVSGCQVVIISS